MSAKIALVGGAGAIGNSIASALRGEGTAYRVIGRDRGRLEKQFGRDPLAEFATWNPDDPASIREALRGIEAAVYLVGVPYNEFHLHPVILARTLDAAVAEGVGNILLIGTVYPLGLPQREKAAEDHPRNPHTRKGKWRKEQEDLLLEADRSGRIRGAILRLPDFYGPGVSSSYLHSLFVAAANGGHAQMVGPIDTPHEFVYVPDVGPVVTALIRKPEAFGRAWHLAGAGVTSQKQLAEMAFKFAGRKPKIFVAKQPLIRLIGLFNPIMRELVEMHYLHTRPVLVDDSALKQLLGPIRKTSYEAGVRASVEAARIKS